jgi:hypothetical protein
MGKRVSRTCTKVMGRSPNRNQPKTAESRGCRNQPRIGCREMLDSCQGVALAGCGKLSFGIRVCLQAYRKLPKMTPALAAGVRGLSSSQHFPRWPRCIKPASQRNNPCPRRLSGGRPCPPPPKSPNKLARKCFKTTPRTKKYNRQKTRIRLRRTSIQSCVKESRSRAGLEVSC